MRALWSYAEQYAESLQIPSFLFIFWDQSYDAAHLIGVCLNTYMASKTKCELYILIQLHAFHQLSTETLSLEVLHPRVRARMPGFGRRQRMWTWRLQFATSLRLLVSSLARGATLLNFCPPTPCPTTNTRSRHRSLQLQSV